MTYSRIFPRVALAAILFPVAVFAEVDPNAPVGQRGEKAIAGGPLRFWPERADQAKVVSATFIGGSGNEWLVGAGIQPDGTVLVAGNVIGPVLELGTPAKVLGTDTAPPPAPQRVPKMDEKNNPKSDKAGVPQFEAPSWRHEGVTGFIARLSPDLKRVLGVVRFPWQSAALTSCVVTADGSIYVAGRAGAGLSGAGSFKELPASPDATRKSGACERTFVAKFSPSSTLEWGYETEGLSDAPRLSLAAGGHVAYGAQDLKTLDPTGKIVSTVVIPGGVRASTSVSPLDGMIAKGGEHHWPTGREPYRCPILNILKPDGTKKVELYNWSGPYVGLDNSRLVSDSVVRLVTHDRAGNILLTAWSDGGNSVMGREATDMRRGVPTEGVGLNAAGAGATSFAYLVKLDPKDYQVIGWTLWCSKFGNKANGVTVSAIGQAGDGSFCIAGGSAWGLVQTKNRMAQGEPAGPYIAVFNENSRELDSLLRCPDQE